MADEVRKLVERTAQATKEIAGMIQSIQVATKNAVEAMEVGNREVESEVKTTSASGTALEEIIKMAEDVGNMIAQIAKRRRSNRAPPNRSTPAWRRSRARRRNRRWRRGKRRRPAPTLSGMALDLQNIVSQFKLDSGARTKAAAAAAG